MCGVGSKASGGRAAGKAVGCIVRVGIGGMRMRLGFGLGRRHFVTLFVWSCDGDVGIQIHGRPRSGGLTAEYMSGL